LFIGLMVLSFIIGMVTWQRFNSDDEDSEQGFMDAKMLSSELPISTFTHPDFKEWVNGSH